MKMTKKHKTMLKYAGLGALAMVAYNKMYGEKASNKSGLAMNLGGLALQANPGHYGALHTNPHCMNNPACMGAINLSGIHLGGAHKGAIHLGDAHMGAIHLGGSHLGAIHLGGAHMGGMHTNPGYMSGSHMGGVVRKGMSNRRNISYHG